MTLAAATVHQFAAAQAATIRAARPLRTAAAPPPDDWRGWLAAVFSSYVRPPFAPYQEELWNWFWAIEAGEPSKPFIAIWPRGFGKSTSLEVGCGAVAARRTRRYALYVCATQDQADTHVQNIASLLESKEFAKHFPAVARRRVGKYGQSSGWRRNRLRTSSGFTVDAIGLDTASRGIKIEDDRPDLIILDDVDEILDSPGTVGKKVTQISKSILPAGAEHAAVVVGQNLVHSDGIVARLANGKADFLQDRQVSGPHPAITNLVTEQIEIDGTPKTVITGGESTWAARTIADLQHEMDTVGISAFLAEKQQEVDRFEGGIFGHINFLHVQPDDAPNVFDDIQVWVDPAVSDKEKSDAHGIQADGVSRSGRVYRLYSWEARTSPEDALSRAIRKARELKASCVGVETDQGGDTWKSTYELTWRKMVDAKEIPADERRIPFREEKAGSIGPKSMRASQMLAAYERGEIVHVANGTHETLERALRRYLLRKPFDLVDAAFWSWRGLTRPRPKPEVW